VEKDAGIRGNEQRGQDERLQQDFPPAQGRTVAIETDPGHEATNRRSGNGNLFGETRITVRKTVSAMGTRPGSPPAEFEAPLKSALVFSYDQNQQRQDVTGWPPKIPPGDPRRN
jgi:hypothetical protein